MKMHDMLYTIVIILFSLSLISERIANMIKLETPRLRNPRVNNEDEKLREKGVMWRALITGWVVATLSGANFFVLIHDATLVNVSDCIYYNFSQWLSLVLGIFLSGIFISLGSKFWHDMLDIVLEFSNLKKFQANQAKVDSIQPVSEKIYNAANENARIVVDKLKAIDGYAGYSIVPDAYGEISTIIQFTNNAPSNEDVKWIVDHFSGKVAFQLFIKMAKLQ